MAFAAPSTALIYAKLTTVALLWGGTFVAGRSISSQVDPLTAATGRFGIAVVCLLVLAQVLEDGLPRLNLRQLLLTLGLGAMGVALYNVFFFAALAEMPASRTALFVAFNPICVALAMAASGNERLTITRASGIFMALFGALVVISNGEMASIFTSFIHNFGTGEAFMCGAVLSWVGYTVIGRKVLGDLSPLAATAYAALWGFGMLVVASTWTGTLPTVQSMSFDITAALLYLAIGGTVVPFVWYYQGVQDLGAGRAAVFTNLVPFFGVSLGFVILKEPLTVAMLAGGGMVILGVAITNR
jgi:drug/metabolite transporter (DMT)-like permease